MSDLDDLEEMAGELVPPKKRRRFRSLLTHCKRGHELTPANLYEQPGGYWRCKKCQRLRLLCREDS